MAQFKRTKTIGWWEEIEGEVKIKLNVEYEAKNCAQHKVRLKAFFLVLQFKSKSLEQD